MVGCSAKGHLKVRPAMIADLMDEVDAASEHCALRV
jgi:hypothetical protein